MNYFPYVALLIIGGVCVTLVISLKRRVPMLKRIWIMIVLGSAVYSVAFIAMKAAPSRSFFNAVESGDIKQVKGLLLKKPFLVRSKTVFGGDTGLHLATRAGNNEMASLLLNAGADVNARNESGLEALHETAFNGNAIVADTLLNAGADVNAIGGKFSGTPLYIAAGNGHEAVVKLLLEHGASVNITSGDGETALQFAINNYRTNVIAILTNSSLQKFHSTR